MASQPCDPAGRHGRQRRHAPIPTWLPGNHPEYPSGHACITAGLTKSLQEFFGTKHLTLTLTSTVTGTIRTYDRLGELVADVENARVWAVSTTARR